MLVIVSAVERLEGPHEVRSLRLHGELVQHGGHVSGAGHIVDDAIPVGLLQSLELELMYVVDGLYVSRAQQLYGDVVEVVYKEHREAPVLWEHSSSSKKGSEGDSESDGIIVSMKSKC